METLKTFIRKTSLHEVVLLLAVLSSIGLQLPKFADDPGVGWHLETGRWVMIHGKAPRYDPFLAGVEARPWISDQWLADLVLYTLYSLGSWPLVYAALCVLFLTLYFGFLYVGLRALGVSALAATAGVAFAFKAGQIHFILRPVMLSFICFAVVYWWCLHKERNLNNSISLRAFIALPLLFCLWANLHPGFVLGLFLLGALSVAVAVRAIRRLVGWGSVARLVVLLIVCSGATLLNPYGWSLHSSILWLQQSDYFMNLYEEWLPIRLSTPEGELFVAMLLVIVGGVLFGRGEKRVPSLFVLGTLGLFAYGCFDAVRMLPFFGIVACYPLSCALQALGIHPVFERSRVFSRVREAFFYFEGREQRSRSVWYAVSAVSLVLFVSALWRRDLLLYQGPFGPSPEKFPYEAVQELLSYQRARGTEPLIVASGAEWGGFITMFGQGRLRPVIDDRNTLVGEEFYRRYERHVEEAIDWQRFLEELNVDAVLMPPKRRLAREVETTGTRQDSGQVAGQWQVLYRDSKQLAATRQSNQNSK